MTAPRSAPLRPLRAGAAALAAVAAGAAGHVLAGGVVEAAPLLLAAVLLTGPAWLLTGRERGWTAIAGAELAGQELVHALLSAGDQAMTPALVPADLMLHLHIAAALLVAAWLRLGERRAWAAVGRLVAAWLHVLVGVLPDGRAVLVAARPAGGGAPARRLRYAVRRRGPPLPA